MEVLVVAAIDNGDMGHCAHFRGLRHLVFGALSHSSFITYDLLRRRAHVVLSPAAACDFAFWDRLLLPVTIGVLGTTVGVVPLHCACLDRRGNGLLVAGVSGAGKSTLALALAQRGFALISDDWTYVSSRHSTLRAHGLYAPVKLLPDAIRFFPELSELRPRTTLNGELAYEVDLRGSFGLTTQDLSHPCRVFFLERSAAPGCQFVPCSPTYIKEFFAKSGERLPEEIEEAQHFRARTIEILSRFPGCILRTGEGPQATAKALEKFLLEGERGTA